MNLKWISQIRFDSHGLVPAIVQECESGMVHMLGYMNQESLEKTISSGWITFYSRSRNSLWTKGETSGNRLKLEHIFWDCDQDTLLILAHALGPTCHKNRTSCFVTPKEEEMPHLKTTALYRLENTIAKRIAFPQEGSYTNYLLEQNISKVLKKLGEESSEIIIAALSESNELLIGEIADFLYHLTVTMGKRNLSWADVFQKLDDRAS